MQRLRDYDRAFAEFFTRLARDGITKDNTLFVITTEEEDHFVGGTPLNPGCDGVTTPCQWTHVDCSTPSADCSHNVTEVNANLRGLLATQAGNTTPFQVHADMAPAFYLDNNPAADAPVTRQFERDVGSLTATNPITGQTDRLSDKLVDRVGMGALHMVTGDPLRTPTLVDFLDDDYFGFTGPANCTSPCVTAPRGRGRMPPLPGTPTAATPPTSSASGPAWSVPASNTVTTMRPGSTAPTCDRPFLTLSGLSDDYRHDGRVLTEILDANAVPQSLRARRATLKRLGAAYKQINAPLGRFGLDVIKINDAAVRATDQARYTQLAAALQQLGAERTTIAARMRTILEQAAFGDTAINEQQARRLIAQAEALLARADALAASS